MSLSPSSPPSTPALPSRPSAGAGRFVAARFTFGYVALFSIIGASMPWLPVWLEHQGLSGEDVGFIIAASMVARFVVAPVAGFWADAWERPRLVLSLAAAALLASHLLFPHARVLWSFIAIAALMGAGMGPSVPLLEASNVRAASLGGPSFGPLRALGSVAFIIANVVLGGLIGRSGAGVIMVWLAVAGFAFLAAAILLPVAPRVRAPGAPRAKVLPALLTPTMLLAFTASALIQGSHAFYYGFSSLTWQSQGISNAAIGGLWAWGVAAEVVLLWRARRWERWGAPTLMAIGASSALLRWMLMGFAPGMAVLIPLQMLHALSFGATHLGFVLFVRDHAPPHAAATAQSFNSAFTLGGVLAGATALSGVLFDSVGVMGYWAMIAPAGAGLVAALALRAVTGRPKA